MKTPGMNEREIEFIPDRLIEEPVVFRGLTDSEVLGVMGIGLVFWIPVSVLLMMPFGLGLFGVGIGVGMAMGSLLVAGSYLQGLKRRMPDGLHLVYLKKILQQKSSMFNYGYIEETKSWDIRRETSVVKEIIDTEE